MLAAIDLLKAPVGGPADLWPLKLLAAHGYGADDVIALVAKTEGNGCVNDFSRTLAATAWRSVLGPDAVTVFSGGTEGVISPHVSFIVASADRPQDGPVGALVAAAGRTAPIAPADLGRARQMHDVAALTTELCARLRLAEGDVHLVLVKCPLLTPEAIARCRAGGVEPVTTDVLESMGRSRAASALGVALALGECDEAGATAALSGPALSGPAQSGGPLPGPALSGPALLGPAARPAWSSVASVSSGAELVDCHVLVIGSSADARGTLRAVHGVMGDAIDAATVTGLLAQVAGEGGSVVHVMAKAEADPSGSIRGRRHTMLTDSDVASTRHARAAVGGLLAGLTGDTSVYVSGGAEHQGPPGGGPITIIYRVPDGRSGVGHAGVGGGHG